MLFDRDPVWLGAAPPTEDGAGRAAQILISAIFGIRLRLLGPIPSTYSDDVAFYTYW